MRLTRVDLPLPVGPTMPTICPGAIVNETSRNTGDFGVIAEGDMLERDLAFERRRLDRGGDVPGSRLSASHTASDPLEPTETWAMVLVIWESARTGWKNRAR